MAGAHAARPSSGHGHGHGHGGDVGDVEVPRTARLLLVGTLVLAALLTVVGVVALWPDGDEVDRLSEQVDFAAPGVTFPEATVTDVQPRCADGRPAEGCGQLSVTVDEGADKGTKTSVGAPPDVLDALEPGDTVKLIRTPEQDGQPVGLSYFGTSRSAPVGLLLAVFVVVVLAVARLRGLLALGGLAFSAAVLGFFVLPALLSGHSPVLVGVVGSTAIMLVVLYTTHGWSLRTSAALAGTLAGIGLTAVVGVLAVADSRVTGVGGEGGLVLGTFAPGLSFQGLFACAIIIAGLGVLNDVTITQASAVWEIRAASPTMSRRAVFASGMRIGRDHIASTIYTIVFAYAGTALMVLLLLRLYQQPFLDLLATEEIGEEVVRTLATSIGLVLAVPLTTLIAVATLPPAADPDHR